MTQDTELQSDLSRFLPASLVARLDERSAMREAIQHLNSLQRAVVAYLPPYIAEDEALIVREDYANLRSGAFLFADVSGFTALSERLQQQSGAEGTEILTAVINDYFSKMLEVLANSDGQLLKFAGDALLAFWTAGSEQETLAASRKAVRTGLRMQRAMKEHFQPIRHQDIRRLFGDDHHSQLTMSIGVARGRLLEALVGNSNQRDHIIIGQLPGDAMQAEGAGERDEVIVSAELAAHLSDEFPTQTALADGFCQLVDDFGDQLDAYELELPVRRRAKTTAMFDLEQASLDKQLRTVANKVKVVSRFVAPAVLSEMIVSDDYHLTSQNRLTVTMFVHFTGVAELLSEWGEPHLRYVASLLRRYYNMVQHIVSVRGGTIARTDPYKLGTKLLITFGAPISHADDADRAVAAALEMTFQLKQFNARISEEVEPTMRRDVYVRHRIGITQGETYAGEVGWQQRREYTVMGDDVNLAARLMASAGEGEILISSRVYNRVQQAFSATPLPPLALKGKREPVPVFRVESVSAPVVSLDYSSDMPFVGHDMFMLSLNMTLKQASMGRRRAVALVGDAGIGKTSIAQQLASAAVNSGFRVAWATCQSRNTRRTTWAGLVAQLLDLNPADGSEAAAQLTQRLDGMKLSHLQPALSSLLFGIAPKRPQPAAKPDAEPPPKPDPLGDLFKRVQQMSQQERQTSGVFGMAARGAQAQSASPLQTTGIWTKTEQRTSLSAALIQLLREYTRSQPTLLVIDDLHLENPQAYELLQRVLAQVTQAKLVVVVTYEPYKSIDLDIQTLVVPDLSRDETSLVAMAILHASELGGRLSSLLWERTSGRPLFIESLLRALLDGDLIEDVNGRAELKRDADVDALPENVRELVVSRIDRLEVRTRQVLTGAAVLGEDFSAEELSAVSAEAVTGALAELLNMQIISEPQPGIFRFRHGMTQAVIYETLSRAQRLKLHRAAVGYWREQTGERARPVTLAYHLLKCGLLPQAIEIVTAAAAQAEEDQDIDGAIELYTHAATIFPDEKDIHVQLERLRALQNGA